MMMMMKVLIEPNSEPDYITVWNIEKNFKLNNWTGWFERNWIYSVIISSFYVALIFSLKRFMKPRQPFKLKIPLLIWNISLAIFSIIGSLRTYPQLHNAIKMKNGLYLSLCKRDNHNVSSTYWGMLFVLSKAIELGDTVFIILRKQPLIFLHWYHHVTVLCYTWYSTESFPTTSVTFGIMNFIVHSLMYTYYALKTLKVKVPVCVSMSITFLQLSQMILGVFINLYALYIKVNYVATECSVSFEHLTLALLMYGSYMVLFAHFFINSYCKSSAKNKIN